MSLAAAIVLGRSQDARGPCCLVFIPLPCQHLGLGRPLGSHPPCHVLTHSTQTFHRPKSNTSDATDLWVSYRQPEASPELATNPCPHPTCCP